MTLLALRLDDRVMQRLLTTHDKRDLLLTAARAAHDMGFKYLSWVYLMEREVQ